MPLRMALAALSASAQGETAMSRATRSRLLGALTLALTEMLALSGCGRSAVLAPRPGDTDVDVGYGTRPHSMVTGAIASLGRAQIARYGGTSVLDLLLRMPGVSLARDAGQVGIRVRFATHDPLVVIDGIPRGAGVSALLSLSPADIERIDVLKDGASAGVYGLRGGSGVILVQTRRPR
jgi:TonB-dependent SusC/RagA subfamily outer membrane receptor